MKFKDIINDLKIPFIVSISDETEDNTKVELLVKINGKYRIGHIIHSIEDDIYKMRPEILDYEIAEKGQVLDMNNRSITALRLVKI